MLTVRYDLLEETKSQLHNLGWEHTVAHEENRKSDGSVANPGQFPFKWEGAPRTSCTFEIDAKKMAPFTSAAHADVRMYEIID
jgi:hypothetical protein